MQVSDVYQPQLLTCDAGDSLAAVAQKMVEERVGALCVMEDGRVIGIISERDVTRAVARESDPREVIARQYTSTALEVATLGDDTNHIANVMLDAGVRHLPVVEGHELVGMVSMRDLLAAEAWG